MTTNKFIPYIHKIINESPLKECSYIYLHDHRFVEDLDDDVRDEVRDALNAFDKCCAIVIITSKRGSEYYDRARENKINFADYLSKDEILIIKKILSVDLPASISSRLYDVLWETEKETEHLKTSIELYYEASNDKTIPSCYRHGYIDRLLFLAKIYNQDYFDRYMKKVYDTFLNSSNAESKHLLKIPEILIKHKFLGPIEPFIAKLDEITQYFAGIQDFDWAAKTQMKIRELAQHTSNHLLWGKALMSEAKYKVAFGRTRPVFVLFEELGDAISLLSNIPNDVRKELDYDAVIKSMEIEKEKIRPRLQEHAMPVTFKIKQMPEIQQEVKSNVLGQDFADSLEKMLHCTRYADLNSLRKSARDIEKAAPLISYLPWTHLSKDNRRVANTLGKALNKDSDDNISEGQLALLYRQYILLVATNIILPAISTIHQKFTPSIGEIAALFSRWSAVPNDRVILTAKALHYGLCGDLMTAMHLLSPQLENFIRRVLKSMQERTTFVNKQSHCENEMALGSLIENKTLIPILGEGLIFEINYLFCSDLVSNIRNEVAHGLADDSNFNSLEWVYGWWLIFKLFSDFSTSCPDFNEATNS